MFTFLKKLSIIILVKFMEKKKDLRIIKTQNLLFTSLIKLMKDKSFEEIKVADICNEAYINRSTFYSHYNDKYELLVDFINELKNNLLSSLEKNENIVNTKDYYIEMIHLLLEHIESKKDIYFSILKSNRSSILIDIIIEVAVKDINKRIEISNIHKGNVPTDILVKFYLGAVTSIIIEWLESKNKYTKKDILNYLDELIPEILV